MSLLHIENVTVNMLHETILNQVNVNLDHGKIYALIGHNGAGKSTLMKTIMGLIEKNEGSIKLASYNQDTSFLSFKQQLSYIPEEPFLLSELTAMQHFQLYGQSYQMKESSFNEKVHELASQFEIDDKLNEYPESLSKGMRQKVQMICALLPDIPLLLIDEPFMGLDVYAASHLQQLLREKVSHHTTILLTSHQLDRIQDLADEFIMLHNGKIEDAGKMEDFRFLSRRSEE
ncbi:ABC-type transport system ATP-binding protein (nonfunctional) [Gracilibacillus halophilus YIM-C55.5]|uniref:ABC-type transport system ATP-binding protein (Nonfunctional) n=1 Tax=Gracilibacillus halophilus YIM-C55.5 TaxID=1308866 RepID=N4WAU0_9BACI|nr:ABC transporter ATP-binding protein [Gracilibacillus halophilus]ENH96379.1 ABC-type transport system ATP-binding protein (nonfunctional) [Gracilibacillus halophilus YIM-C55.5]